MATRVFISWSGGLSKELGEALRLWLPSVLQNVRPYFSPDDIEKGAKWESSIAAELETSDVGLICLTRDNTEKPWILFESGALSKSIKRGRVCTVLFGIDPSQIKGPLLNFQATEFTKDEFKALIKTINSAAGDDGLDLQVLDNVFDMWWPQLESKVAEILERFAKKGPAPKSRGEKDMLEEVLELTRLSAAKSRWPRREIEPALFDIVGTLGEILDYLPEDIRGMYVAQLERPLLYVVREFDIPPGIIMDRLVRRDPRHDKEPSARKAVVQSRASEVRK